MVKYYENSLKFCLNQEDQNVLDKRFNELFADYKIGGDEDTNQEFSI